MRSVDEWIARQGVKLDRSEAIRRLVELGLKKKMSDSGPLSILTGIAFRGIVSPTRAGRPAHGQNGENRGRAGGCDPQQDVDT